ncbi:helix-turn-helix domain-containing protein [uncultured Treponema sp.]|uniref:helix-turn-helix domain-containing protein n=1 Tax=uncultured Treponema sp. TaxID=162155 RepID=UPI0025F273E2|nr:helix-turn-helix transcriptional regulator [uncultured Treponema sp.]
MTNIRTVLAVNMKTRRKELEISQAELAEKIGTSPNYISKIEAEKQFPSVQMIEQIASALECDSVDLFSNEKNEEKRIDYIRDDLLKNVCDLINASFQKV